MECCQAQMRSLICVDAFEADSFLCLFSLFTFIFRFYFQILFSDFIFRFYFQIVFSGFIFRLYFNAVIIF